MPATRGGCKRSSSKLILQLRPACFGVGRPRPVYPANDVHAVGCGSKAWLSFALLPCKGSPAADNTSNDRGEESELGLGRSVP